MPRPIQPKTNKDHWGFYKVGDYKTYSKLEAVEVSGRTGKEIVWDFNSNVFDTFDWTKEPPGDLKFWYRQRAEQLREAYDYIVLYYSGGWDTNNVLRTFVENDIFIDEILHAVVLDAYNGDIHHEANYEAVKFAIPRIKNLIETNPTFKNTKQNIVDYTKHELRMINESVPNYDFFYNTVYMVAPNMNAFAYIKDWEPSVADLYYKHKRVCHLYGIDKPRLWKYPNGECQLVLYESAGAAYHNSEQRKENPNWTFDEMFYFTPDMPELLCKQAHTINRVLDKIQSLPVKYNNKEFIDLAPKHHQFLDQFTCIGMNGKKFRVSDEFLTDIIYPEKTINVGSKACSLFLGFKDAFLWDDQAPYLKQRDYFRGLAWFKARVKENRPDLWWEDETFSGGIKLITNKYQIQKGK